MLDKIAPWKILVQMVFRLVQLVFKYWFSWFLGWFSWYSNNGSAGHSTGFCTVHFFLPVCCVSQKAMRSFLKTGSTGFGTGSIGFCAEKSKTTSFGAPPIYTHSYLSPPQRRMTWTPFLT
jgi:hypothetical protein